MVDKDKPNHFSADNYGDITKKKDENTKKMIRVRRATVPVRSLRELSDTHWESLITTAREHLLKARTSQANKASRFRATSAASTLVEEEEDPDADFVMVMG